MSVSYGQRFAGILTNLWKHKSLLLKYIVSVGKKAEDQKTQKTKLVLVKPKKPMVKDKVKVKDRDKDRDKDRKARAIPP